MIKIELPDGDEVAVVVGNFTWTIANKAGVAKTVCVDNNNGFEADEPVAEPVKQPMDVELAERLTMKRIPPAARATAMCRIIVWDVDPQTGSRSVHDIIQGSKKDIIWHFNHHREDWIEQGCSKYARIEPVNED